MEVIKTGGSRQSWRQAGGKNFIKMETSGKENFYRDGNKWRGGSL